MKNSKHKSGGIAGSGYYIALILCAAAIGITGYLYYRHASPDKHLSESPATTPTGSPEQVEVIATRPVVYQEPTAPETTQPAEPKTLKTTSPVSGETVGEYAMDCLSYNSTTRDWRVHNGMDIAAPAGTPVVAAADGEVYTVYEDDTMGNTVVIRHLGNYTTRYASLDADPEVHPGDRVRMGQTIGKVGTSALLETELGPHVHFAVTHSDEPMDPQEFLELG